jgi:hypothetical protein
VGLAVANPRVHLSITFDNNGNYVFNWMQNLQGENKA